MKNFFDLPMPESTPGQIVAAFRKKLNLTLKEVEKVTGIKESNLSAIERSGSDMSVRTAVRLAAVLGIHPEYILFPNGRVGKYEAEAKRIEVKAHRLILRKQKLAG